MLSFVPNDNIVFTYRGEQRTAIVVDIVQNKGCVHMELLKEDPKYNHEESNRRNFRILHIKNVKVL